MYINEFIRNYQKNNPTGKFFDEFWLNFFGESLKKMTVSQHLVHFKGHKCYVLTSHQKNSPKDPIAKYYFDCETFEYIN